MVCSALTTVSAAVSDRVIFEENEFICTEKGVVPHGNSISGCDRPKARLTIPVLFNTFCSLCAPPSHSVVAQAFCGSSMWHFFFFR